MDNFFVSVIVPIYNAEKTLERCIKSVLEQEKVQFELLLIDDGSSDRSREICEKYTRLDDRIKLITNTNHGVSYTRNIGIDLAKGNYLFFLDADDWIEEGAFFKVKKMLSSNDIDVLFTAFHKEYKRGSVYVTTCTSECAYYSNEEKEFNPYHTRILGTVWGKFYKRDFIGETRFNKDLKLCEDAEFNYRLFPSAKRMMYVNISSYHYSYYLSSTVRGYNPKQIEEYCKAIANIEQNVQNSDEIVKESALAFSCNVLNVIIMNNIFSSRNRSSLYKKIKILKQLVKRKYFANAIKKVDLSLLSKMQKSVIIMLKKKVYVIIWIFSILNKVRSKVLYQ